MCHTRFAIPNLFLNERFTQAEADRRLHWFNAPAKWRIDPHSSSLLIEPDAETDFWNKTHYGFEAGNGHLFSASVTGNFVATTRVRFHPANQYDQAGLMVRRNEACWLKTSVEYEGVEPPKLGAVATNHGYSDWSVQDFNGRQNEIWLRITRMGDDFTVEHSTGGESWSLLRLTHLDTRGGAVDCGIYACSPKGAGFRAEFDHLQIELI